MARIDSPQGDRFPAPDSSSQSADPPAGLEAENRMSQGPIRCRDEVPDPTASGAGVAGRELLLYDRRAAYHHELELRRSGVGFDPADDWIEGRLGTIAVSHVKPERLSRRVNRLCRLIRVCGALSIVLGVVSATFLWPRVRLPGLVACGGLGMVAGLLGLGLRPLHRGWRRRLADGPGAVPRLARTKAHRCRVGLGICAILLATGLLIELSPRTAGDGVATVADVPAHSRGPEIDVGGTFRLGDLSLRIASGRLRQHLGTAPRLELVLEARNVGTARKLDFNRMRDIEIYLNRCDLWDGLANTYHRLERPDFDREPGREAPTALYPGESLRVRLVFERPVHRARQLQLLIPAGSFHLPEAVLFRIDTAQLDTDDPR